MTPAGVCLSPLEEGITADCVARTRRKEKRRKKRINKNTESTKLTNATDNKYHREFAWTCICRFYTHLRNKTIHVCNVIFKNTSSRVSGHICLVSGLICSMQLLYVA